MSKELKEVWVAAVTHRHGVNTYAAKTNAGINKQLAEYCRENWDGEGIKGKPDSLSDEATISAYFDVMNERDEFYECDRVELGD